MQRFVFLALLPAWVACQRSEAPKAPEPVPAPTVAPPAAPAPLERTCVGASIDLDWALASPTCAKKVARSPTETKPPAELLVELAAPDWAKGGEQVPVKVTLTNTSDAPMNLVVGPLRVHALRPSGSRYDRPDMGVLGLLTSDPEEHQVIALSPKGHAVGSATFTATGFLEGPKETRKGVDFGKPLPLPPGKYRLGLNGFPFYFVQPKAIVLKGEIEVR